MKKVITGVALALGAALAVAACGSDDSAEGDERAHDVPAGVALQYETIEEEVGAEGGETTSGPWRIAYIVEPAEPWFEGQRFRSPAPGETHHIEILPIERETGRLVPDVPIRVAVRDHQGRVVDQQPLDFFHAEFFHYAGNFSIPREGEYDLEATIGVPTFLRHGEAGETPPLSRGAKVTFEGVELERE